MSEDKMSFQKKHSRNGYAWAFETDSSGRLVLVANGGVRKVCGLVVTALGRHGRLSKSSAAEYLRANFHPSFTANDLSSVFKQLVQHGIARRVGTSHNYTLTRNGAKIWRSIDKV